ncbi:P1 family peptidase [Clostridium aminobutyricum]|uniref:P1 family peptidase n=1 Tax=Clostridium aminobutyricum TaxID=33953 RepID=A0A939D7B9_CLOAM|nr:P1 family peptidase [Clostridium aminobutyricum]MBN7772426.1 P1 family peptidase [Clostridium aminobutyricum]
MKEISVKDIRGIRVGHAQNRTGGTGCTAIICENGAWAGVDVRGGGPATRETDLLKSENLVQQIHCVMLSGGSAYGLDACSGAMQYLEERNCGFDVGVGVVPIVCGASLFDLVVGDAGCRPDKAMGYEACRNAEEGITAEGNVGAGTGATVGKYLGRERLMKSGLGIYAVQIGEVQCAAVVAVNALGDVIDIETGKRLAGILNEDKTAISNTEELMYEEIADTRNVFSGNTTIGCIITNAKVTKPQANKLASIAHNGYARAIRPVHTSADGDTIFVMATGEAEVSQEALGALAAEVMAKAINRAVLNAESAYGIKAAKDFL